MPKLQSWPFRPRLPRYFFAAALRRLSSVIALSAIRVLGIGRERQVRAQMSRGLGILPAIHSELRQHAFRLRIFMARIQLQ